MHSNALTMTHARRLIVARHQDGRPQAHIAKAMGISRNRMKKWLDRCHRREKQDWATRPHAHTLRQY